MATYSYPAPGALKGLMSLLHAILLTHWNAHWKSSGPTSYGDHLLFQRMYEAVQGEIDTLAEKLSSGLYLTEFSHAEVVADASRFVSRWEDTYADLVERSLEAEKSLQIHLQLTFSDLEHESILPLGLNDYLASVANTHDTHIFLLHRRSLDHSYFRGGN